MTLWLHWWNAIALLRPAFSRQRSFLWFVTAVAGLTVRTEHLGVTSIVRALSLKPALYDRLLGHFHSEAVKPDALAALWTRLVLKLFPAPLRVNGRLVLVGDGIKAAKRGKKMPGVKLLHQQTDSNKAEYIMGHSLQAICLLVQAAETVFAVPLAMRIHEGIVWSNRDKRTLLDKMLALIGIVGIAEACYFVGDAYYASGKIINGLLEQNHHLVTRARSNAVAYRPFVAQPGPKRRGRPQIYDKKVSLKMLFRDKTALQEMDSPVYGETDVKLQYQVCDLLWRPARCLVRFVAVIHPNRGRCVLMCTDLSLSAADIIRLYGLRFKIEHTFKQAVNQIGTLAYHFWMQRMKPLKRRNGNQYMHREPLDYRDLVKRKLRAYHLFIQAGIIAQGLLQYLAVAFPQLVWDSFGSWLRTIRSGIPPSELVVATALRQHLPEFLLDNSEGNIFKKFILERQDKDKIALFRMTA